MIDQIKLAFGLLVAILKVFYAVNLQTNALYQALSIDRLSMAACN
jgi:hypothetical protein